MTETEKQELSKAVAEKYGIDANSEYVQHGFNLTPTGKWLHDDSARCFDLFAEHDVVIGRIWQFDGVWVGVAGYPVDIREEFSDHPTKQEATRIAILRALLAKD